MTEKYVIRILEDTPESLVTSMDGYALMLQATPWWDFSTRRFLKNWIIRCHYKRLKLLGSKGKDNE